jgi:recombination protein RecA
MTATKKATPKRKSEGPPQKRATQLEVLTQFKAHFAKKYGDQLIVMGDLDNTVPGYVSTQSLALDWICGNTGVPMSRIVDASGDEGVGKSTFGDHLMAEVQRLGGHAWLWDTENARDDRYQRKIGIARQKAGQIQSHTMEDGLDVVLDILGWHLANDPTRPGIILWDTPAGMPTRAEANPEKTDERFGPAKIIRSYLRKLNQLLQQMKWIFCVVNQTYMGQTPGGQSYKAVYGGGGIPFYSSVRLSFSHPSKFWRSTHDKELGLPPIGQTVWVKCVKNRVSAPHRSRQIAIHYGEGFSNSWDLFNTLSGAGAINQAGGWYSFDPAWPDLAKKYPKKFQGGHLGLEQLVREHAELWADLLKVYHQLEVGNAVDAGTEGS